MLFLGNKAFVIDFLETGVLCCVCLRPTGKDLSGENKYPRTRIPTGLLFKFIWCVAIICQQGYVQRAYCVNCGVLRIVCKRLHELYTLNYFSYSKGLNKFIPSHSIISRLCLSLFYG